MVTNIHFNWDELEDEYPKCYHCGKDFYTSSILVDQFDRRICYNCYESLWDGYNDWRPDTD